jgi:CBS domain-containing protein
MRIKTRPAYWLSVEHRHPEALAMRAHQIMSRHVITIGADAPVLDAIKTMLSHHISGLPVVGPTGTLVGIVSESDFLRRTELGTEKKRGPWPGLLAGADQAALDFARRNGRKVDQVMSRPPVTIDEETSLDQIVRLMETHNIKRLPVMRDGQIIGMVTRADFLAAIAGLPLDTVGYSASDDQIRRSVLAALSQASWRPCALNVSVHEGIVVLRGSIKSDNVRKAIVVAAENVRGVSRVEDQLSMIRYPASEQDYGGGDFVSLQAEASTDDDEPL